MKVEKLWIFAAVTLLALAGCHKAEPPATVQSDVAQARDAAAEKEAETNQKAATAVASANEDMAAQSQKADRKTADAHMMSPLQERTETTKLRSQNAKVYPAMRRKHAWTRRMLRSIWPWQTQKQPRPQGRRRKRTVDIAQLNNRREATLQPDRSGYGNTLFRDDTHAY